MTSKSSMFKVLVKVYGTETTIYISSSDVDAEIEAWMMGQSNLVGYDGLHESSSQIRIGKEAGPTAVVIMAGK